MKHTKWYFSRVHLAREGGPHFNAVRIERGLAQECNLPPTRSEVMARRRVDALNDLQRGIKVEVK